MESLCVVKFSDAVPFYSRYSKTDGVPRMKLMEYERAYVRNGLPIIQPILFSDLYVVPSPWEVVG